MAFHCQLLCNRWNSKIANCKDLKKLFVREFKYPLGLSESFRNSNFYIYIMTQPNMYSFFTLCPFNISLFNFQ